MTKLLSGEEAKLAWANGEQLQVVHMTKKEWETLTDNHMLSVFDDDSYEFRLKPRTIMFDIAQCKQVIAICLNGKL